MRSESQKCRQSVALQTRSAAHFAPGEQPCLAVLLRITQFSRQARVTARGEACQLGEKVMARFRTLEDLLAHNSAFQDFFAMLTGGSAEHDHMNGTDAGNMLFAGRSNDTVAGMAGNDMLSGGSGDDKVWGGSGNDRLMGDNGNDLLVG